MICTVLLLFCVVAFLSGLVNWRVVAGQRLSCKGNLCPLSSEVLNGRLATRVPACSDFYAHVCAEWDEGNLQSPYEVHLHSVLQRLQRTLAREPVPSRHQSNFQKAAALYQSCLAVLLDGKSELREAVQALRGAGVWWPRRSQNPDLLLTAARLRLTFDLDAPLVFKMPDAATLSVEPPSSGWLRDAKRLRYALDFSGEYTRYFSALWSAIDEGDPVVTDSLNLRATEDALFSYLRAAESSSIGPPKRETYIFAMLPDTCAAFPRHRWNTLLREIFNSDQETVTAVEVKDYQQFSVMCRMVRDLREAAVHYYVEWLAVQILVGESDRTVSKYILNGADFATLAVPSACLRKAMQNFGEPVLIESTRRWLEKSPALLSDARRVAKDVRESLSEIMRNDPGFPDAVTLLKDLLPQEPYAGERERLVESIYSVVPDMSQGYLHNLLSLLNSSINRDTIDGLGFSWEALENTLHDGASDCRQVSAGHLFLKLSYAAYFLHNADMPQHYNYAAFGVIVARQLLALYRQATRSRSVAGARQGLPMTNLGPRRSDFSISVDAALIAAFKAHDHKSGLKRTRDFFLMTCFQVCSGRNTREQRRNFTLAFTASKAFQTAFSCHSEDRGP